MHYFLDLCRLYPPETRVLFRFVLLSTFIYLACGKPVVVSGEKTFPDMVPGYKAIKLVWIVFLNAAFLSQYEYGSWLFWGCVYSTDLALILYAASMRFAKRRNQGYL